MIKLVATDIDGTIVAKDSEISVGVKNCIKTLQEKGVPVVLVTGRMYIAARQIAERLGLNTPVVAYQGGLIKKSQSDDSTIYEAYIPESDCKNIINWARKNKVHLNLYSDDKLYVEEDNFNIQKYAKRQNIEYKVQSFDKMKLEKINKLLAIDYANADNIPLWIDELQKDFSHLYIVKSTPNFCEFSTMEATKACAIEELRKYYNLEQDEVLCIGDQDNDIELLKAGGVSVAMGNATEELKKYADYVTDTVDNDGFVKAMNKFVIGEDYV